MSESAESFLKAFECGVVKVETERFRFDRTDDRSNWSVYDKYETTCMFWDNNKHKSFRTFKDAFENIVQVFGEQVFF